MYLQLNGMQRFIKRVLKLNTNFKVIFHIRPFFRYVHICFTGKATRFAKPLVTVQNFDENVNRSNQEMKSSTIPAMTEVNIKNNLENRIQTMWQLMLTILAVLLMFALTYLGKCLHRQWTSRTVQVSNTNSTGPGLESNESRQIELYYEQIQDVVEDDDRKLYLTAVCNESHGTLISSNQNTSSGKIDSVSNRSMRSNLELSSNEELNSENVSESVTFDSQQDGADRGRSDLYITPIM